jgi:hypothetical protein
MLLAIARFFNPFPANKRHLGSAPKSDFCNLTGKTEVIGLSDLITIFIQCLYCKQTQRAFKHTKLIENRLSKSSYSKFN